MKKTGLAVLALALVFISMSSVGAEELRTAPFTSLWNDYKTMVPDGWKVGVDDEGTHYTNISFKSPEPNYLLSIRWYTRYSTHRMVDGLLEMYSGPDDFVGQIGNWFGAGNLIEQGHEINIADRKAQRFMGRLARLPQGGPSYIVLGRRARLGGVLVGDDEATNGGRQVWTVVPAPSGFYAFGYFAPEEGFAKYEKFYDRMIASFVPLRDGPGGAAAPGISLPVETADQKLQRYLSKIKLQRDMDKEPVCKEEFSVNNRGDVSGTSRTVCRLFATADLRKEIIEFVSTMKPAPAIPDPAQRYFIQGNTITKAAKNIADYNLAINKYKEALIEAPWWGDAYNNLAIALNSAGHADLAKQAMEIYLFTKPADALQAQKKIYEIEAQAELQREREAAMRAKYGGRQGGSFGWESLFRYGAVTQKMSFDASGNERTISLKIVTRKENGLLRNYFQITDITSQNDIFLQTFSMDWRGTNTFFLDDRTYPNKELMTFTVTSYGDGDANITIRPANNASASIKTSLTALLKERAGQAVYAGDKLTIGEREFYVLGQGGRVGSLLFFPVEIKGLLESGSAHDLMTTLVANVNYRTSDGRNQSYTNTDLGDVSGAHYHLEHDGNYWKAVVGRGENH